MIKDGNKMNQLAPAKVRPGDRPKASTINRLIDAVGFPRVIRENPMKFRGGISQPWTLAHSLSGTNNATCTITAGTISYGSVDIAVAGGDVTLTGTPEFVYVRLERSNESTTLGHASTRPASDSTYAYFVLASFTSTYGVYSLTAIHHKGDIYLQVPMQ